VPVRLNGKTPLFVKIERGNFEKFNTGYPLALIHDPGNHGSVMDDNTFGFGLPDLIRRGAHVIPVLDTDDVDALGADAFRRERAI